MRVGAERLGTLTNTVTTEPAATRVTPASTGRSPNEGADMKVVVDRDVCQDHGQCCFAAPAVFHLDDEGHLEYDPEPDDSLLEKVEAAADFCPVQAISYEA